jgi:hypothetical protein
LLQISLNSPDCAVARLPPAAKVKDESRIAHSVTSEPRSADIFVIEKLFNVSK